MSSTLFKVGLIAATAAALLCVPGLSSAALAGDVESSPLTGIAPPPRLLPSPTLLVQTVDRLGDDAMPDQAEPTTNALRFNGFGGLSGNAELLLWNLCAVVRSHQGHHAFERLDVGVESVKLAEDIANEVSAVPLPGAVWLLISGALGLIGLRRSRAAAAA